MKGEKKLRPLDEAMFCRGKPDKHERWAMHKQGNRKKVEGRNNRREYLQNIGLDPDRPLGEQLG